jgi:hypothetical protein
MNRLSRVARVGMVVMIGGVVASCEKSPTESLPAIGPGEFAFEMDGAVNRVVTGDARVLDLGGLDVRLVALNGRHGYPNVVLASGSPGTPFGVGEYNLDPAVTEIAAWLELTQDEADIYDADSGTVRILDSGPDRMIGEFEFTGRGRASGNIRVRGEFHAVRSNF